MKVKIKRKELLRLLKNNNFLTVAPNIIANVFPEEIEVEAEPVTHPNDYTQEQLTDHEKYGVCTGDNVCFFCKDGG
jgi:hypothetical protein